jgi:hypothetical protein
MLPWEAVTAIATAITAIVIAATVVVGYRQVQHLRRATQLQGTLTIFEELTRPEMRAARRFVVNDLPDRMKDPQFAAGIAAVGLADEDVHKELYLMRAFEKLGTYVRYRFIEPNVVCDFAGPWITDTWETLDELGIITTQRRSFGHDALWENFELLYNAVRDFDRRQRKRYSVTRPEFRAHVREIVHPPES